MRTRMLVSLLAIAVLVFGAWRIGRAQSTTPFTIVTQSLTHTSCPAVIASTTQICFASDGIWQSLNGAVYTQVGGAVSAVTSVTVCNVAGASCGSPQTGAVSLNIPKTVTVTVGAPTVTATQGAVAASLQ